jgi:hypothetical protein
MVTQKNTMKNSSKPESFSKKLLLEVANLNDGGADRFWKMWPFKRESSSTLYRLGEQLRHVWEDRLSGGSGELSYILDHWVNYQDADLEGIGYKSWRVSLTPPSILPTDKNLRGSLAFAVLAHFSLLAVCGNPDCPARYFIGRRSDQKYCGGDCTEYAQRQYALKYWNEEGKHRRAEKSQREKKAKGK